jgi:hypothetical protein
VDPILLNKLLAIADEIEEHNKEEGLTFSHLQQIVARQSRAENLIRRTQDILRVLFELKWLSRQSESEFSVTPNFTGFIRAWEHNDLLAMNRFLALYPPYAWFLNCLCQEQVIQVPKQQDKKAKKELGQKLHDRYQITFVALDTFWRTWAVPMGQAYFSPFNETLYWGGNWDDDTPSIKTFRTICWENYCNAEKTSNYANIGRLADVVCRQLSISFLVFEMKMNVLVQTEPKIKFAPLTVREPTRGFQIVTLCPRLEILREQAAARLRGELETKGKLRWTEYRYLEDGIRINNNLVRLIKWEALQDA